MLFGLTRKEEDVSTVPGELYNIEIEISGWRGPFRTLSEFSRTSQVVDSIKKYRGEFIVLGNGKLKSGRNPNLVTYKGELDIDQSDHIHHGKNGKMTGISMIDRSRGRRLLDGYKTHGPVMRLEGLYNSISNNRLGARYAAITTELERHGAKDALEFLDASIVTRKDTRLKFAEMQYRKYISDQ